VSFDSTYKNCETVWLICHYDMFSQILYLKKAMNKHPFVSMKHSCLTCEKGANQLEYNFFEQLACIVCIVAVGINSPFNYCCAVLCIFA
jgi:hypothetical protein